MSLRPRSSVQTFGRKAFNYFTVYMLTGFSGTFFFPFKDVVLIALITFFTIMFLLRHLTVDKGFLLFFFYCFFLVISQSIVFSSFSIIGITRGFMTFIFGYLVIKLVGINFTKYFINIIFFFTIISLFFYISSLFSPTFHDSLASVAEKLGTDVYGYNEQGFQGNNFIIYTWRDWTRDGLLRNAGNYTEAGAFGSVLVIVLLINVIEKKILLTFKNSIFIIAIISTFSTSSYIALSLFLFFWFSISLNWKKKIILYPIFISVTLYLFSSLPFLKNKIETQYEAQIGGEATSGRFSSAILDLRDISKYPITGRGFSKETRSDSIWKGGSNGITGLAVTIAPIGILIYFFLMYKSFRKFCWFNNVPKNFSYMIIIVILTLAFSQYILSTPLLYSFVFYGSIISNKKLNVQPIPVHYHTKL